MYTASCAWYAPVLALEHADVRTRAVPVTLVDICVPSLKMMLAIRSVPIPRQNASKRVKTARYFTKRSNCLQIRARAGPEILFVGDDLAIREGAESPPIRSGGGPNGPLLPLPPLEFPAAAASRRNSREAYV